MPRASLIVLALIVLPFAAVGDPVRAETVRSAAGVATPSPAPPTPPTKLTKVTDFPPIVFFVARGEADACGRDCAEWIAADGAIDLGAPARLRALLNRLGRRRLPIYFHSPGGSVSGALAIGRLLRERGLTAGLAWTVPQGCDPKVRREAACDKLKRSGRDLPAQLDAGHTMCNSACVYAFVGAAVREVAPGASLGIHSSSFSFVDRNGHASVRPSATLLRATATQSYALVARYLGDMGIDPALLTAARRVASDHIRFLTRAEIRRFNIDRRTFVESDWRLVDEPTRTIRKVFMADRTGDDDGFRATLIQLSCVQQPDRLRIVLAREVAPGDDASAGIRLAAGGSTSVLKTGRRAMLASSKTEFDVGATFVPADFFLKAGDAITVSAAPAVRSPPFDPAKASAVVGDASDSAVTLSTVGLDAALAKLLPTCGPARGKSELESPASSEP